MQLTESDDYSHILLNSSGLLDVRAPIEFNQGAFPRAANLPILNDQERHQIGLRYKHHGQDQAIEFGHQLVQGSIKQQRIQQWVNYVAQQSDVYLYCFRGGLRSKITQQWLHEAGIEVPRVQGGYKALRHHLIRQLDNADQHFDFVLLGGMTGCKKTHLINQIAHGIDLEGAAHHRGSSFGAHAIEQSSQINFENQLALDFLREYKAERKVIALEDESRFIGSVNIPKNIFSKMRTSPLVVVESSTDIRLQQLLKEYIVDMEKEFNAIYSNPQDAFNHFSHYLLNSLERISKRLGLQRWNSLANSMKQALAKHRSTQDTHSHLAWLEPLLSEYYDPMYTSQLTKRAESIIFRGSYSECYEFLNHYKPYNT